MIPTFSSCKVDFSWISAAEIVSTFCSDPVELSVQESPIDLSRLGHRLRALSFAMNANHLDNGSPA